MEQNEFKQEVKRKIDTCHNFNNEIGCVQADCMCEKEETKQETIEEAAEKEFPVCMIPSLYSKGDIDSNEEDRGIFIEGAKSNAAKDYWFEQFKNKFGR